MVTTSTCSTYSFIPLTKDQFAIVDAADYEFLSQWKWCAEGRNGLLYAVRRLPLGNKRARHLYMHRVLLGLDLGLEVADRRICDHINGNSLDNRRGNLRIASKSQDGMNRPRQRNNTTGFKGVSWDKCRSQYAANIAKDGRGIHLGRFATKEEAHRAYCKAAALYHGAFARVA